MKKEFPQYYLPSKQEFEELWETCVFVLDTSVLLNLYRYRKDTSNDLFKIFDFISERLWVPHQVALEYQENRLTVIAEQVKRYDDVKKVLKSTQATLSKELAKMQLSKRHSTINPDMFLEEIKNVIEKFESTLTKLADKQPGISEKDKLREKIEGMLDGKIGQHPNDQDELDKIYKEGQVRYGKNRPPGYEDAEKEDDDISILYHHGLAFRKEYGDLILWKELIKQAKENPSFSKIIFITDDTKDDWWWKVHGKNVGARPELIDEIQTEAKVDMFYMYSSKRFMKFAEEYLKVEVKTESINEVEEVTKEKDILYSLSQIEIDILQMSKHDQTDGEIARRLELTKDELEQHWHSIYKEIEVTWKLTAIIKADQENLLISVRELEVLEKAKHGLRNKEIAQELNLGAGTIRNYLSSAYRKLGSRNRTEAIYKAEKLGLLKS